MPLFKTCMTTIIGPGFRYNYLLLIYTSSDEALAGSSN